MARGVHVGRFFDPCLAGKLLSSLHSSRETYEFESRVAFTRNFSVSKGYLVVEPLPANAEGADRPGALR
jgi:hypothetical protein